MIRHARATDITHYDDAATYDGTATLLRDGQHYACTLRCIHIACLATLIFSACHIDTHTLFHAASYYDATLPLLRHLPYCHYADIAADITLIRC